MKHFSNQDLDQLEPNYLALYGLFKAPFAAKLDDKFLFLDADRVQRLNMLHHLTQYSDLLLIVTGVQGVGKTSLLNRFVNLADDDWRICNIEANALMDNNQLIRNIVSGFDFDTQHSASSNFQQLFVEDLSELKHSGAIPILIIDDAHELPIETLESIFNLANTELNDQRLLRIILFSDPSIDVTLKSSKINHLRERVTHSMELAPFSEEQTEQYIYHRLTVAGLKGSNPIDHKILRRIYRSSEGYPDQINKLTHIALQGGIDGANNDALFSERNYNFPTRKYLVSGSVAAIIIGLVLTIQNTVNNLFDDSEQIVLSLPIENRLNNNEKIELTSTVSSKKAAINAQSKSSNPIKKQALKPVISDTPTIKTKPEKPVTVISEKTEIKTEPVINLEERIILLDKELKSPDTGLLDSTVMTLKPDNTPIVVKPNQTLEPAVESAALKKLPKIIDINPQIIFASKQAQKISIIGQGFGERSYVTVNWSGNSKRLSSQQINIVNDSLIEITLTTGLTPEKWSVTITHPKNGKSNTKTFVVKQAEQQKIALPETNIHDEQWILAQDKNHFTLQLLGVKNKQDIINFTRKKKLKGNYGMFTSTRNGELWYHLIYGSYKNKLEALTTVKAIPKKIGIGRPWIRPLIDVQNAIKRQTENKTVTKISTSAKQLSPIRSANSLPNAINEQSSWLWGQSPTHYTLQLLGARTESRVKKFVLLHKLQGKAIYFNVKRQGKDWYSLVYGVYPDKGSAIKARTALSKSLQKAKPWPRSFASIHTELDKNP